LRRRKPRIERECACIALDGFGSVTDVLRDHRGMILNTRILGIEA
jgi:hypothetical protein